MNAVVQGIAGLSDAAKAFLTRKKQLLINNNWVDASSGRTFACIDPATEKEVCQIQEGVAADIDAAVKAARQAFDDSAWSRATPYERQQLLLKLADLMEANAQELAELEALDVGKVLMFARMIDVDSTVEYLRYMAGWATKIDGRTLDVSLHAPPGADVEFHAQTLRQPIGVCGQIIPWNFPLAMAVWKLSPALAAGNTCVLKPAEQTCLTALRLGELIVEAGFPPGVVNIVTGFGETAGQALVEQPEVVQMANDTVYGLAASIWSSNVSTVHRLVKRIRAGSVWVNTHNMVDPHLHFGGFKQSGIGREMGIEAIHMYTEIKSVLMAL